MRKDVAAFAGYGLQMYLAGKLSLEKVAFDTHCDG